MKNILIVGGTGFLGFHLAKNFVRDFNVISISSKKPKFSFVILFLFIEMEPIFFKYHPNIGINNNSFFKINIGELKMV